MGFLKRTYNGRKNMGFLEKEPTMVEKRNKRGLSTIVATLLIILLTLVAVGVIWMVVRNVIQSGTEQISLGKITLDLEMKSVSVNVSNNSMEIKVKRNTGSGEFVGLSFIIEDGSNSEVIKENVSMEELETRNFQLSNFTKINISRVTKVSIAPIFRLESGKEVVGDVKDEYIVSTFISGVGEEGCNSTCSSLGYTCGTQSVCGASIDCGTCGTGYTCTSGTCAALCDLTSAIWNMTNVTSGQPVRLIINGTNCSGRIISFTIWEKDGALNADDAVTPVPSNITFTGTSSYSTWASVFQDDTDLSQSNPPEYYFTASVVGYSESITSSNTGVTDPLLLTVTQPASCGDGTCNGVETCSNCVTDCGTCPAVCGNSIIEGTESCDCGTNGCISSELGGATCATILGTGYTGTLNCSSSCGFNTTLCVAPCTDTCSSLGYICGTQTICGVSTNCGTCGTGYACNSSGKCVSSCTDTCSSLGYNCGTQTVCGVSTNCGTCGTGYTCTSGNCVANCTDSCSSLGYTCGYHTICGTNTSCGTCGTGYTCQTNGTCTTNPCTDTCSSLGYTCGTQTVCGVSTSCGTCGTGYTCTSGNCVAVSNLSWHTNLTINTSLPDIGGYSTSTVFYKDGIWNMLSEDINFNRILGFSYNPNTLSWGLNLTVNMTYYAFLTSPFVFYKDSSWYTIMGLDNGVFIGYILNSNGTWISDSTIVSGLPDVGTEATPTIFQKDGTWYLLSGSLSGRVYGYRWTGSAWAVNTTINSSLSNISIRSAPSVFQRDSSWYLISGAQDGNFYGYRWTGSDWETDLTVNASLPDIGGYSKPSVFQKDGSWYLISGSGSGYFYGYVYN